MSIEETAKRLFQEQTFCWTGHTWCWDEASEEIKAKWRAKARAAVDNEKLRAEVERLSRVLRSLYEWYDRDGSVGGASQVFEDNRAALEEK